MMESKRNLYSNISIIFVLLLTSFLLSTSVSAKVAAPTPPTENPHAPTTAEDRARVTFAIDAVTWLLMNELNSSQYNVMASPSSSLHPFTDKDLNCIKKPECYESDINFLTEIRSIRNQYGRVTQMKNAHIIPWSFQNFLKNQNSISQIENRILYAEIVAAPPADKQPHQHGATSFAPNKPIMQAPQLKPDEYMVHLYVQFDKQTYWHHLDVILSEDNEGKISLRHFFVAPMMATLPPGVVC